MGTEEVYKGLYGILGELWAFGGLVIKISCKWFSEENTVAVSYTHLDVYKRQGILW